MTIRLALVRKLHQGRRLARLVERVLALLAGRLSTPPLADTIHRENVQAASRGHDMGTDPDEAYYAQQYLRALYTTLDQVSLTGTAVRFLDLGCGQGRVALALAERFRPGGGEGVAVDFTPAAVCCTSGRAAASGLPNLQVLEADILDFLRNEPPASYDLVLFLEVAFFMPDYREALKQAHRVLRPGGLLAASFWSLYYRLLGAVQQRDWHSARQILAGREGYLGDGGTWFSWHTAEDVRQVIGELGFSLLGMEAVGALSGIRGDPLSSLVRPSRLPGEEGRALAELEKQVGLLYPDTGRYILALARKEDVRA